ncbi:ribonuclease P protein subunit p21 [Astyanax mexicanus]|uniref:Ribonuclease P protein subunit p21-like n=2 Tax=Astyanax mexicanus TaxID=7994 RepID=A0A8B9HDQ5_ASTMX|nr:ribonuclease P protein subunit p21 [Astyanax mexicanus]KAG9266974.1 ribonuclease P protein subunit p21-like [Astyanax mexicanus]
MAGIKDKEAFQRLNFLYQAAHCVLAQNPENIELARFYCFTQKTIARRLVLRQDPSVKRTLCKRCCSLLIPGVTSTARQRSRRRQCVTVIRCLSCGLSRKFPNNPKHQLWVDQPEAQLENQPQTETQNQSSKTAVQGDTSKSSSAAPSTHNPSS